MTRVIGLTGGIGTGKSTAAAYLRDKGFSHIDADEIGRELTSDDSPLLGELDAVFGPGGELGCEDEPILREDGSLDRKALARAAFAGEETKKRLDDIMLKHIIAEVDRRIDAYRSGENGADECRGMLLDAPLLFEAGLEDRCDDVLLITARPDVRIGRVCERDGASEQDVRARMNCQMSDDEKVLRADHIVDNSGSLEELYRSLDEFLETVTNTF